MTSPSSGRARNRWRRRLRLRDVAGLCLSARQRLADDGLVATSLATHLVREVEEPNLVRLWAALGPMVARHETSLHLDSLADLSGLSPRQVHRDAQELCERFRIEAS